MKKTVTIYVLWIFLVFIGLSSRIMATEDKTTETQRYQTIEEDRFRDIFMDYLYQNIDKDPSDIVLSRFKVSQNTPVSEGKLSFQIIQKNKEALKGNIRLIVIVKVDDIAENEVKLMGWVDVFGPVVCSSRNLKKGELIQKKDIYLSRKNITRQPVHVLTDPNKAVGLLAASSIKRETCLMEWMLEKAPILNKGDRVMILAQLGRIRITVPGIILEKGYTGERIRVQNVMSSKEIYARVINPSTVSIDF